MAGLQRPRERCWRLWVLPAAWYSRREGGFECALGDSVQIQFPAGPESGLLCAPRGRW